MSLYVALVRLFLWPYRILVHEYSTLFILLLFGCLDYFQYGTVINGAGVSIPLHLLVPRCRCCVEYTLRVRLTDFQVGAHLVSVNDGASISQERVRVLTEPQHTPRHCLYFQC